MSEIFTCHFSVDSRPCSGGYTYVYLSNEDAAEVCSPPSFGGKTGRPKVSAAPIISNQSPVDGASTALGPLKVIPVAKPSTTTEKRNPEVLTKLSSITATIPAAKEPTLSTAQSLKSGIS